MRNPCTLIHGCKRKRINGLFLNGPKVFAMYLGLHYAKKNNEKVIKSVVKKSRTGLELDSKLPKLKLAILLLHKKLDGNFS